MDEETNAFIREHSFVADVRPLRLSREHGDDLAAAVRELVGPDIEVLERPDGAIWIAKP